MVNFFCNNTSNKGGPGIFGRRLANALCEGGETQIGHYTRNYKCDLNISIISGGSWHGAYNLLRLDGLYLDSGMGKEKLIADNNPMFNSIEIHDKIVYQSEFSKTVYEAFYPQCRDKPLPPSVVIPNGVPCEFNSLRRDYFTSKDSRKRPLVLASSSWRRHKRLEEIIEAFKDPRLVNVDLAVLGGLDYYKDSIPDNVMLLGFYNDVNLLQKYNYAASAMVHLCWLDSCPNTVVEALACGTPVVCSHNGGTKELVKDNGVVLQLEEDYIPGELVNLYNPPQVDINLIVEGILEAIEIPIGFDRPDLRISNVADKYLDAANLL